jgi:hypothetical protein
VVVFIIIGWFLVGGLVMAFVVIFGGGIWSQWKIP